MAWDPTQLGPHGKAAELCLRQSTLCAPVTKGNGLPLNVVTFVPTDNHTVRCVQSDLHFKVHCDTVCRRHTYA
jgi:hypothetical protein